MKLPEIDPQELVRTIVDRSIGSIVICVTCVAGAAAVVLAYLVIRLTLTTINVIENSFRGGGL